MEKTVKMYRHGEIGFLQIEKLPEGLTPSETKCIMSGSHGNSHTFDDGVIYLKQIDTYVFWYLVAKNTKLFHPDHGEKVENSELRVAYLPDGIYELRKQQEVINLELKPVID